ncbi:delta(3,5)-Delta(2,4)-dienoyl-CoA isomerase, mitochondrial [Fopius arisanus]|uniref:Delta(3,5)-Delta(2,4)-dienoyl-CoA isomerase, mitochondrial n=1 Tax=Fopius arisanus TaxID=64838 RepID=A0A0C9R544_9HYME|nr:PREDICTED: delta(3,5)-Delta(2,4)-dienoyl-CoA isomerase, mitochondrial [Fopius arisanus]
MLFSALRNWDYNLCSTLINPLCTYYRRMCTLSGIGESLFKVIRSLHNFRNISHMSSFKFDTLSVSRPKEFVYKVQLNRPDKMNSLNNTMWLEIGECFKMIDNDEDCRVVMLTGAGKAFCAGIDLQNAMNMGQQIAQYEDIARKARLVEKRLTQYQDAFLSIEKCRKPIIAAIHGLCIGAALNMICGVDIRYCSKNAWFSLKEVDLGMAADVGALQWLPKIVGSSSLVRELAFTGRKIQAEEALQCGLVSQLFKDDESLWAETLKLAEEISQKSPVAVQNTKKALIYSRDHTVPEGLEYMVNLNQAMLQSEDFIKAAIAIASKGERPIFSKL